MSAFFDEVHSRYGDPALFAKRVRQKLALHGISQGALATRAGFEPTHVSKWLSMKVKPEMLTMALLDEALETIIKGE